MTSLKPAMFATLSSRSTVSIFVQHGTSIAILHMQAMGESHGKHTYTPPHMWPLRSSSHKRWHLVVYWNGRTARSQLSNSDAYVCFDLDLAKTFFFHSDLFRQLGCD